MQTQSLRISLLIIGLMTAIGCLAFGQTKISGIAQQSNGGPIPFANILVENSYDGTTADENGKFSFVTGEIGSAIIIVRALGFKDYRLTVQLSGAAIEVKAILPEQINELDAVTISAGSFTASDQSRRTVFRAVDIATTAGATADIAGALNTLPGTQKVGESGRLFVRGGDGSETRTFIDGMVVLDAYSPAAPNTPSRGRFLPFMFKGTSFSTGGYSAEYGQALSSALVLDSKDQSELTRTDIGIMSVGGDVAHTQAWEGGSAAAKLQYTNLTPYTGLINQEIDWKTPPVSYEGVSAFRQKVNKTGMFKLYTNFNQSSFSLYRHDIDNDENKQLYELGNGYRYINAAYKEALNENWIVRGGMSYTSILNKVKLEGMPVNENESGVHGKVVFEGSLNSHVELKTGAEWISREVGYRAGAAPVNRFTERIASSFAEADWFLSNRFVTRLGVRSEYNTLQEEMMVDPRVSLAYKTGKVSQVSLAAGRFHQSVNNQWLRQDNDLGSEQATHWILNYQRTSDGKTLRIETFHKQYDRLVKFNGAALDNSGYGFARGMELFWRDNSTVKYLDYWVSYSLLDTRRNYLNYTSPVTPVFASTHNFSVVGKYFIKKLRSQSGVTYSFTSARPYNNPNEEKMNSGRTPSYQDLSINWSYLPKPYIIVYVSCTNVLGRDNIFGYEYSHQQGDDGIFDRRAVRQPAPRFIFIGIFITLSKEKSVNQLPTL